LKDLGVLPGRLFVIGARGERIGGRKRRRGEVKVTEFRQEGYIEIKRMIPGSIPI
jgi:hypothetical protein